MAQRQVEIFQVDAFTDKPFCGNPAGVVIDASSLSESEMQLIAREMNLSETAFVKDLRRHTNAEADFEVRFFTPKCEVDLCGHATIGTFWLLAELGAIYQQGESSKVLQKTRAGILPVIVNWKKNSSGPENIIMEQSIPKILGSPSSQEVEELAGILHAPLSYLRTNWAPGPQVVSTGLPDLILPVADPLALSSIEPNMQALSEFCKRLGVISVHCVAPLSPLGDSDGSPRFRCRDFAPAVGIPEEPATGTASGATGAYLVLNEIVKDGSCAGERTVRIELEQGLELGRPSNILVEISLVDSGISSIKVGGKAVTVMKGNITLPE